MEVRRKPIRGHCIAITSNKFAPVTLQYLGMMVIITKMTKNTSEFKKYHIFELRRKIRRHD